MKYKVLIIDDNPNSGALIKDSLSHMGIVSDYYNSCVVCYSKLEDKNYQLILRHYSKADPEGLMLLKDIKRKFKLPVLMMVSPDDLLSRVQGLSIGADDYIIKPFRRTELAERIRFLIQRYTRIQQLEIGFHHMIYNGLIIDLNRQKVISHKGSFTLTQEEFEILVYCAKNQGKIVTKREIYEHIWHEAYHYNSELLVSTINSLHKKIEPSIDKPTYLQIIQDVGYRFNKEV